MEQHPRGIWIWRLANLANNFLDQLVQCNVKRVYLKICDGKSKPMFWSFQCTKEIIQSFKIRNIQVFGWGYHYGTSEDIDEQVLAVKQAFAAGIEGYVIDVEKEVEDAATHPHLRKLLEELRLIVPTGSFGYTSFGHPGFHSNMPWKMLDEFCDIALPQIYFEKFRFKPTNEEEVQECLKAHKDLQLTKPILPIWGSESNTVNPATATELQRFLDRFPGSSLWRFPDINERGEALRLNYSGRDLVPNGATRLPKLSVLTRVLRRRSIGDDVTALQKALEARGFPTGGVDSDFGVNTERAVKAFQLKAGLTVDGEVGPDTWAALNGDFNVDRPEQGVLARLADLAQTEGAKQLRWQNGNSEAEKYLEPLREPMRKLGHIGSQIVFFDWCASFVTWCCREAGIDIPDQPQGFWATMALVESWKFWAQKNGFWHSIGGMTPRRGDILVFEWFDGDVQLDHIGIVRGYTVGSSIIQTSEGNRGNVTSNGNRELKNVAGIIRIIA
jgi:hypothetical protein